MGELDCRKMRESLSAYLEGDLDPAAAAATRAHLEGCAACRAELELERLTIGAFRRLPDLPPPAGILAGVRARLQPEPWYRRLAGPRRWLIGVPAGAVATVLVVIGVSLFQARFTETEKMGVPTQQPTYPQPAATAVPAKTAVPAAPAVPTEPPVPIAPQARTASPVPKTPSVRPAPVAAVAPERKDDRLAGAAPAAAPAPASAPITSAGGYRAAEQAPLAAGPRSESMADRVAAPGAPPAPAESPVPVVPTKPLVVGQVESKVDKPLPPAAMFADESGKDANEQFQRQKEVAARPAPALPPAIDDRVARQPARAPAPRDGAVAALEESDAKARSVPAPQMKMKKEAAAESSRDADRQDEVRRIAVGGERSTISRPLRVVCLLAPDGGTIDDLKRLLERAGAHEVRIEALDPRAVLEAYAPHRDKRGLPREAAGGWDLNARVPAQALDGLIEELASRHGLHLLERPAARPAPEDPTERLDVRLTVLQ